MTGAMTGGMTGAMTGGMKQPRQAMGVMGILIALCAAGLSACAPAFVAQRPYPTPEPGALLAQLRQRQSAVRIVDLETRTTSWLGGDRNRASVLMLVDRAGRLRFEVEVPLQGTVATLVTDGNSFTLLDLQAHVVKRGPACPANVGSLIPVPLHPREIAAVLLGDAPLSAEARAVGLTWDGKAAADVLEIDNGPGSSALGQRLWVSLRPGKPGPSGRWDVVALEAAPAGGKPGERWRVSFEKLVSDGGFSHPDVIRVAEPGRSFDDGVEVVVKSRRVNPSLLALVFTLAVPDGYPVTNVPCCPGCTDR
jgi:hypothetical protein